MKVLEISIFGIVIITILIGLKFKYNIKTSKQNLGYLKNKFENQKCINEYLDNILENKARAHIKTIEKTVLAVNASTPFIKPSVGRITSRFGGRRSGMHTGLDIATPTGTPIKAAASGNVTFAGWKGGYGNLVIISHGNGIQTYYAHCSVINVNSGDNVLQGQKIAEVGSTGNSTGSHVHLEIRINGNPVNPELYI